MDIDFTVRWYQQPFYLALVGQKQKRLIEIAHRRWGKDEIVLNGFRDLSRRRVGTYWHCFPEYAQARKAIWNGVNGHTGKRRIDEAFPPEIRKRFNDNDMFIETVWGSTWQLLGSDRYDATVGSGPVGIAYSEWALCNPAAWAYHKPMIEETDGTAAFITTPRGANHAKRMFDRAVKSPYWFAELSSIHDTKTLTQEQINEFLSEYIDLYGDELGTSLFEQEYLCSFEAAIIGSYYGSQIANARKEGRILPIAWDESLPVMTVWDIGFSDDTVILFVQIVAGEVRIINTYDASGRDLEHYASILAEKPYEYSKHWLPHDAQAKTLAAAGRSVYEQLTKDHGLKNVSILKNTNTEQQGIIAARQLFPRLWIDDEQDKFIDALTNFRREWDDDNKCFRDRPVHDWTNHYADSLRYLAWVWKDPVKPKEVKLNPQIVIGGKSTMTMNHLIDAVKKRRQTYD
jgi:phage terminase large subunit